MIAHIEEQNIDKFTKRISYLASIMQSSTNLGYMYLKLSWLLIFSMFESAAAIKKIRELSANCHGSHKDCNPKECAKKALSNAREARNSLFHIHKESKKIKFISFISPLIQKSVIDWDDLMVDLTISCDSELNEDISLLSDAI